PQSFVASTPIRHGRRQDPEDRDVVEFGQTQEPFHVENESRIGSPRPVALLARLREGSFDRYEDPWRDLGPTIELPVPQEDARADRRRTTLRDPPPVGGRGRWDGVALGPRGQEPP